MVYGDIIVRIKTKPITAGADGTVFSRAQKPDIYRCIRSSSDRLGKMQDNKRIYSVFIRNKIWSSPIELIGMCCSQRWAPKTNKINTFP